MQSKECLEDGNVKGVSAPALQVDCSGRNECKYHITPPVVVDADDAGSIHAWSCKEDLPSGP